MKIRNTILISLLMLALVAGGCSKDRTTTPDGSNSADVTVRLQKSSLVARVDQMRLTVSQNEAVITQATTTVVDGAFTFGNVILPVGTYFFVVEGVDILPDDNQLVIYSGSSQVEIGPGSNPVSIDVAPSVQMVRIAPYELLTAASATFTSKLEIWNIPEFRSGSITIQLDPTKVTFVGASASNEDWGTLEIGSEVVENELTLNVTRVGGSDVVPSRQAILDLSFSAVAAGVTSLEPVIVTIIDDEGDIPGLATVYEESQCVRIVGGGGGDRGVLSGYVYDATSGGVLQGALVSITGPASRQTTTDETGLYLFEDLQYGTYEVTAAISGYISLSRTVDHSAQVTTSIFALSQQLQAGQYRIVLSWGENPADLDSHVWTTLGDVIYEIYYGDQGSAATVPFILLDTDDVDGYGPETITIYQLTNTTVFAVKNYSSDPAITTSGAQVEVYSGSQKIGNYSVPTSGTGIWWYVFDLSPQGVITERNTISDTPPLSSQDGAPAGSAAKSLR